MSNSLRCPWTALLFTGFSRQACWGGLPRPTPEGLSHSGTEAVSRVSPPFEGRFFTTEPRGKPRVCVTLDSSKVGRRRASDRGSFPFSWNAWARREPQGRWSPRQPAALTPRCCCASDPSPLPLLSRSRRAEPLLSAFASALPAAAGCLAPGLKCRLLGEHLTVSRRRSALCWASLSGRASPRPPGASHTLTLQIAPFLVQSSGNGVTFSAYLLPWTRWAHPKPWS